MIAANSGVKCDVKENVTNRSAVILCETLDESDSRSREFNAEVNFNERAQDSQGIRLFQTQNARPAQVPCPLPSGRPWLQLSFFI